MQAVYGTQPRQGLGRESAHDNGISGDQMRQEGKEQIREDVGGHNKKFRN